MSEFALIDQYCRNIGAHHASTRIGVGDDAAVVEVPADQELVVSVDTMVEGVHFAPNVTPENLAYKLMAVNLSDMAAMGAEPKWATLAMTIATPEESWLASFSSALDEVASRYGVQLIGGDTTAGPLTLSVTIMGLSPKHKAITRAGARVGDDLYVSGVIGDAALALRLDSQPTEFNDADRSELINALHRPIPQVDLGLKLRGIASACLDISDGLIGDLNHIAEKSGVGIEVNIEQVPLSPQYQTYLINGGAFELAGGALELPGSALELALTGGDDYQLAFTASPEYREYLAEVSSELGVRLTRVGCVRAASKPLVTLLHNGEPYNLSNGGGYQHFA